MDWFRNKVRRRRRGSSEFKTIDLETYTERRIRWRSVRIIYFTVFMMSLGFSIILTGVWPFLVKLDPKANKVFLGFIVAANPLGQMMFSPLFGYWGNKSGTIRAPMLVSLSLFTLASATYSILEAFPSDSVRYWMTATRFLVGISSASIAVCRSYLSSATTLQERTGAVSMVSLAQVLGFIIGPSLQMIVTPLGDEGIPLFGTKVSLNMYTAASLINVVLSLGNLLLFLPGIFVEQHIAAREAMRDQGAVSEKETWEGKPPNHIGIWTLTAAYFVLSFNFVLLETLGTVLVMDQFAWNEQDSLKYLGLLMSAGGIVSIFAFAALKHLCRWFDERSLMIYGGFVLMVIGRVLYIPWGSEPPQLKMLNETTSYNGTKHLGCPVESQPWCAYTPAMTIEQLLIGYAVSSIGYPIGITLIQTLFSKVLGTRPQGVWMGLITGSGCFSRVLGPVFVTFIYEDFGTIWTFSLTAVMLALTCLWLLLVYKHLKPPDATQQQKIDGAFDQGEEMQTLT